MSADNSPKTDPATSWVWLWERKPLSVELGKVRIPASWVPDGWLPQLQHRYDAGDRIRFTYRDKERTGTIVQDQGSNVAVDGDTPKSGFTLHKTDVHPLDGPLVIPQPPDLHLSDATASPHDKPVTVCDFRSSSLLWPVGPTVHRWQRHAALTATFYPTLGIFTALTAVDRATDQEVLSVRPAGLIDTTIDVTDAKRASAAALKRALTAALELVREAFDAADPDIIAYFTTKETP